MIVRTWVFWNFGLKTFSFAKDPDLSWPGSAVNKAKLDHSAFAQALA
jgi:hypothetical protein